ncbi:MAG: DUF4442 domain-containing protein [Desulfuromonadales bacterium]|jgi:acyl-coenzyme A thioesterase PaaI-like protein|nr:DUF4442 domain-containing protein [Desulfuromonadales bacterium]
MDITEIPFAKTIGLTKADSGVLELCFDESIHNHLQTVAASAQYSLAELASGEYLLQLFPGLIDQVVPVLRDSRLKFRRPAQSTVSAFPSTSEKAVAKFTAQLEKKGRALIAIDVAVKDSGGTITSSGRFSWYVRFK